MSFGASGSSQQTQSQSKSAYDPTQTSLVNANATAATAAGAPGGALAYTPFTGAPLNFGDPTALNNVANFSAPSATATGVSAGQIASTDLSPYLNPYSKDVIDTTTAQLSRQNSIDNTAAAGAATQAGAFGGSRSAVLQNLNTDSYQRNLGSTVAGINAANYTNALGAAGTDIGNRLNADEFSAAAKNTASLADQQASLASANTRLQALGISAQQAQAIFGANWASYLNSQTDPQAVQQTINQAYGIIPTSPLTQSSASGNGSSFGVSASAPK